ncbi:MAG: hypothetical protein ACD_51C00060G0002 [uncultured bacterium]|nr:MAG: hypothetical protein ACD_51C00060G0002 [uncultured bacterium]OGJ47769.1 MAG: hypothetical protein A2244_03950 [Candidatus Peregrinibacteria bacterium RIFOXYA2_FULL_41_18]OGJ49079.1 MAG: hypothetical protein A2344_05860 [Candidatus Peregrinibacteria bacterium RIFOXYB12_FULL_41_12]OGJ53017.1 MAG: hypothetical protein A2336_04285 [Candidatus Peregrinibacteria bacterium RIFOXYB2_FULL_41_88]OGJ53549.1 MAG: hypothetical protein A2448_04510 [Candidatus Peregrinibacteria bacterium RIFOXYC2_FULL
MSKGNGESEETVEILEADDDEVTPVDFDGADDVELEDPVDVVVKRMFDCANSFLQENYNCYYCKDDLSAIFRRVLGSQEIDEVTEQQIDAFIIAVVNNAADSIFPANEGSTSLQRIRFVQHFLPYLRQSFGLGRN